MGKRSKRRKLQKKIQRRARLVHPSRKPIKPSSYKDSEGNIVSPIELTFPIIRYTEQAQFEAIGTGFFFHPAGGFITAKHNLFTNGKYDENCFAIHSVGKGQHLVRKIQYFEPHPNADIGVGMLRGQLLDSQTHQMHLRASLSLSLTPPQVEDDISTLAYPRMKIRKEKFGKFPCDRYTGVIIEHRPDGTAKLPNECYVTNMQMQSGSSGGPVLRGNHIVGVNCSSFELGMEDEPISFITPVHLVFDLPLTDSDGHITTIRELMNSGHVHFVK
ncbi:MAG: serine protease [Chitinophagaceae bacterium]|nr:MAG: serine protease [Chitinophagaceae bacterium]